MVQPIRFFYFDIYLPLLKIPPCCSFYSVHRGLVNTRTLSTKDYKGLHIPAATTTFTEVSSSGSTVTGCARYQHIDCVRKLKRLQRKNTVLSLEINAEMKPSLDSDEDEEIGTYQKKLRGDE